MSDPTTRHPGSASARNAAIGAVQWLRERFPQARIASQVLPSDEALIAVRVSVEAPDGPAATGHGVALAIEEAEDRGLLRAIEGLGYLAPAEPGMVDVPKQEALEPPASRVEPVHKPTPIVEEPEPTPITPVTEISRPPAGEREPGRPANPAPLAGKSGQMGPPVMVRPRQTPATRPASQRGGLRPVPDPGEDEPRLEDVSWTEVWKWARPRGFESRESVIEAIGETIDGMTPRQVREALLLFLDESDH